MSQVLERLVENFTKQEFEFNASAAACIHVSNGMPCEHDADIPFEFGSCMKAIVLAATCAEMDKGSLTTTETLTLEPDLRVPASLITDQFSDGTNLTVDALLRAMISVSDNTATEMIWQRLGSDCIRDIQMQMTIPDEYSPRSVKEIYALEDTAEPYPAFRTTTRTMSQFYTGMLQNTLALSDESRAYFWDVLRGEDTEQGTVWPEGIECFRKSGSVVWNSVNAQAVCGVIKTEDRSVSFALALNRRPGGDELESETWEQFGPRFGAAFRDMLLLFE